MSTKKEIFLKDYESPYFFIETIDMTVDIFDNETIVSTHLTIKRNKEYLDTKDLILDGVELELKEIKINNEDITEYEYKNDLLTIRTDKDSFDLFTKAIIHPETNLSCEGLYASGNMYSTQCEAQGFRKITFFPDAPHVMAKYTTTVIGDKNKFPVLLSNGNLIDSGELDNGRHFTKWEDPFKKPSYLFALVAGDLAKVSDTFTTMSGKEVALEFFVDHGNEDKVPFSIEALQDSMKWDEEKYGREYDLDLYMVVAVDAFNMGAMENKGLNIFNSSAVLAKKETATDTNFQSVQAIVAHEYFHNWTGNRVTCRDWFQLTLKEGLTVFRDQEFSADMLSRSVKRIEDVKLLRDYQFPEDAGPISHPILPKSFVEINNFYTSTIYDKGAEVIRMIHTLIGTDLFRKGTDLYFDRHDGQAVTTEDFVAAMADASGKNLDQFKVWYDQNGTPILNITTNYNAEKNEFSFTVKQSTNLNNKNFDALHIPFIMGLVLEDGTNVSLPNNGLYELTKTEETFIINNIPSKPTPSWNRNFSAPVKVEFNYSYDELISLVKFDQDDFNRYDAAQLVYKKQLVTLVDALKNDKDLELGDKFTEAFSTILNDQNLDNSFKALALSMPTELEINDEFEIHDYDNVKEAKDFALNALAFEFSEVMTSMYESLKDNSEFSVSPKAMGKRAISNRLLSLISNCHSDESRKLIRDHFSCANNMTDEFSAFSLLCSVDSDFKQEAINSFYSKWNKDILVMQKWIAAQSSCSSVTLEELESLEKTDVYDKTIPNFIRAVFRGFIRSNPAIFNAKDGSGYEFISKKIVDIDSFNPQIAAGLAKSFSHINKLDPGRKQKLIGRLEWMSNEKLSSDTLEVVTKTLEQA